MRARDDLGGAGSGIFLQTGLDCPNQLEKSQQIALRAHGLWLACLLGSALAERMFARNWSAKVEYLYLDLGNVSAIGRSASFPSTPAAFCDVEQASLMQGWRIILTLQFRTPKKIVANLHRPLRARPGAYEEDSVGLGHTR
jgi:hypothetical protein